MRKIINRALTPKQKKILDFITGFTKKKGYAPSLEEIADKFGLAISTVHQHVKALRDKGYLKKEDNQPRGMTLPEQSPESVEIPLLGLIAAGSPIEPIENPEPIKVPRNLVAKRGDYYALKVKGDSMIDMGVLDKDIVLIKHQMTADVGDVVVGITEDGATLKILGRKNGRTILEPRNPNYKTIIPRQLEVRGVFVGLIRAN
ncbi:MAG: transcriptional repressor LexA [Candidatus Pacebacteria bacterium]|nr:transcriptional repressor LexA [Candidatus Paceibacterota bacterium]